MYKRITHGYVGKFLVTEYISQGSDLDSYTIHGDKSYVGTVDICAWTKFIYIKDFQNGIETNY